MNRKLRVELFDSFEEENEAEYRRRVEMTVEERCAQFAALQARMWGEDWGNKPIVKIATWERVDWYCPSLPIEDQADAEELERTGRKE